VVGISFSLHLELHKLAGKRQESYFKQVVSIYCLQVSLKISADNPIRLTAAILDHKNTVKSSLSQPARWMAAMKIISAVISAVISIIFLIFYIFRYVLPFATPGSKSLYPLKNNLYPRTRGKHPGRRR
jgi:hypothetical protein